MTTYFERQLKEIEHSIHSIDMDVFEKMVNMAVETIKLGHKIIVSGLGKNVPICDKFVGSMISLGLDAYFLHTNSAVHGDMGIVKDGDMVIILTKSGRNGRVNLSDKSFKGEECQDVASDICKREYAHKRDI